MKKCNDYFLILAIPLIITLNIGFAFAAEEVSSFSCDNGVVNIGDVKASVEENCGEPDPNSQTINRWVYKFDSVYTLIFKEDQLIKILEDEWGN